MKLEIKHLASYLPYKLKAKFKERNDKKCRKYVIGTIHAMYDNGSIVCYDTVNSTPDKFKPILLPLKWFENINSPVFKEINCDLTHQIEINEVANKQRNYTQMSVGAFELCLENHVDIFDLIPKKLAISV